MSKHGELTEKIAENLSFDGFDVFYDHGNPVNNNVGEIVSSLGLPYKREDELAQLDIAIVEKDSNKAIVLVEIEETSDRPKTLLGDLFGVLFGKHISFNGNPLDVGGYTTLVVAGISKSKEGHALRNDHIEEVANRVRSSVGTPNSKIGKLAIKVYKDQNEILKLLPKDLEEAVRGGG